jgi:hypothetical protein
MDSKRVPDGIRRRLLPVEGVDDAAGQAMREGVDVADDRGERRLGGAAPAMSSTPITARSCGARRE